MRSAAGRGIQGGEKDIQGWKGMTGLKTNTSVDDAPEFGYGLFAKRLSFEERKEEQEVFYQPPAQDGEGYIYQLHPAPGLFVSLGDWRLYEAAQRPYKAEQTFFEIYFLESGDITLIQNGKKARAIPAGVNLYINKPNQGRICYGAKTPIRYVSLLLFPDFIRGRIKERFPEEDFEIAPPLDEKPYLYNTPELTLLFLQLKQKMQSRTKMRLYYESKVGEILSLILSNCRQEKERLTGGRRLAPDDAKCLERARSLIDQNILNPPGIPQLCPAAAMGETKLRDSFKTAYGKTLGEYIREAKLKHALLILPDRQMTIQSIAFSLGYASPGKFSQAFKKVYGVTPDDYRRSATPC
jgi:AraC-like DNA-binding protein